ncbi:MAG: IS1380 family transposase, partial [Nitrospirae bacterium]|nr:IS1380 family transposase [Nitrospirota bacterium]
KNGGKRADEQAGHETRNECKGRRTTITPDTPYGECSERLTAFGGLLALVKFLDLIGFEKAFAAHYVHPKREAHLGGYRMVLGMLMLLFIGFQRLGHFAYVRTDAMVCGILRVGLLPAVSTFWRYLTSLGIVQSASRLRLGAALRARVWVLCAYAPRRVTVNIDTTVATVYGAIEGARKGHNTKHRGKKGLRPVLCFLDETREYLCGTQRRGETIRNEEVACQIGQFRKQLPELVREVHVRGDGEFIGWESVNACLAEGFRFTFGNKRCDPPFPDDGWYRHGKYDDNECVSQPMGWEQPCRFVVMRIRKDQMGNRQLKLLDAENDVYRVFVTNEHAHPHRIIDAYDQRADVENLIGEAQREGVLAIPSRRFQAHHAFFQIVMLAYNLWRWMKMLAGHAERQQHQGTAVPEPLRIAMPDHTIRIARLKMLFVAAKIRFHSNRDEVCYSVHEQRAAGVVDFLDYLDRRRKEARAAA